jgi:hypothetical protein
MNIEQKRFNTYWRKTKQIYRQMNNPIRNQFNAEDSSFPAVPETNNLTPP